MELVYSSLTKGCSGLPRLLQLLPPIHSWVLQPCSAIDSPHKKEDTLKLVQGLLKNIRNTEEGIHICTYTSTLGSRLQDHSGDKCI